MGRFQLRRRAAPGLSDDGPRTDGPRRAPTGMARPFLAATVLALLAILPAWAQDPLKSPECKSALDELERVLDEKAEGRERAQRVASARRKATVACLGRADGAATRSGAPYPPQAVPPPVISGAPPLRATPPAPPLAIARPTVITTCDPAGCWDSEGRRLNHVGPLLLGPRGPCLVQGGLATCP